MRTLLRGIVIVGLFACLYGGNAEALQFDLLNLNYVNVQTDSSGSTPSSWLALNHSTLASVPLPSGLSGSQGEVLSSNALSGITAFLATYGGLQGDSLLNRVFAAVRGLGLVLDLPGIGGDQGNNNGARIAVPIPGSFLLFAASLIGFAAWHRRWLTQEDLS